MHHELFVELSNGFAADNGLAVLSIRAGEAIDSSCLIELCSGAKTMFLLATLVCRELDRVSDCRRLWSDVLETFGKAQAAWSDVALGPDPMLRFYLGQLGRLHELAAARVDLYSISSSERLIFVHHHKSDIDSEERTTPSNGHCLHWNVCRRSTEPVKSMYSKT